MLEIAVFILAFAGDLLLKLWSILSLAHMPGGQMSVLPGVFWLQYAENHGNNLLFLRGQSQFMIAVRAVQFLVCIVVLIVFRRKLGRFTRVGITLFVAGLLGNQLNYIVPGYVPDMFVFSAFPNIVFNLADVYIITGVVIIGLRIVFYEGPILMEWLFADSRKKKKKRRKHSSSSSTSSNQASKQVKEDEWIKALPPPEPLAPVANETLDYVYVPPAANKISRQQKQVQEPEIKTPDYSAELGAELMPERKTESPKIRQAQKKTTLKERPPNWPERLPPPSNDY